MGREWTELCETKEKGTEGGEGEVGVEKRAEEVCWRMEVCGLGP